VNLNNIPEELKLVDGWHLWKLTEDGRKIPVQIDGQTSAASNKPDTWSDYETALRASIEHGLPMAFELGLKTARPTGSNLTGLDLDGCLDGEGFLAAWAEPIVEAFKDTGYCEVSQSGTGIKITTFAKKPDGFRCTNDTIAGAQSKHKGLEVYGATRFWAMTGDVFRGMDTIGNGQDAVDKICNEFLSTSKPVQTVETAPRSPVSVSASKYDVSALRNRADAYISGCDTPISNRNNMAFRISGNLRSIAEHGEKLSDHDVLGYMLDWNNSLPEPLPQSEIETVCRNSATNGTPPADKPSTEVVREVSNLDAISEFVAGLSERKAISQGISLPQSLIESTGFIGQVVRWNLQQVDPQLRQPELALGGAITLLSALTGGKLETRSLANFGKTNATRTNIITWQVAKSGSGKQAHRDCNEAILSAADIDIIGPRAVASSQALFQIFTDNDDSGNTRWQRLLMFDEVAGLLKSMGQSKPGPQQDTANAFIEVFNSSSKILTVTARADAELSKGLISYPHMAFMGTTVPESFWSSLGQEQIRGGLLGRTMLFGDYTNGFNDTDEEQVENDGAVPESIVKIARAWMELNTAQDIVEDGESPVLIDASDSGPHPAESPIAMTFSPEAKKFQREQNRNVRKRSVSDTANEAGIWNRQGENVSKVAMLICASRWDGNGTPDVTISLQDMKQSVELLNYICKRMAHGINNEVTSGGLERRMRKVLDEVTKYGKHGISKAELARETAPNKGVSMTRKEREETLQNLIEMELVFHTRDDDGAAIYTRTGVGFK